LARKLNAAAVYKAVKDAQAGQEKAVGLVIAGEPEVAAALAGQLGGDASTLGALRVVPPGAAYDIQPHEVVIVASGDQAALLAAVEGARRARAELIVLLSPALAGQARAEARDAGVYEDELVVVDPCSAAALKPVAEAVARAAGDRAAPLARRLPVLRDAAVQRIIRRVASQNGAIGAVVFVPGVDLPAMTLNQVRMMLQIGTAYGRDISLERVPEVLGVVVAGLGLRAAARQVLGMVPLAGWAVKGAFGYAGTLALGEAAIRYYESGVAPVDPQRVKGLLNRVVKRGKAATA